MKETIQGMFLIRWSIVAALFMLALINLNSALYLGMVWPIWMCGYGQFLCSRAGVARLLPLISLVAPLGATLFLFGAQHQSPLYKLTEPLMYAVGGYQDWMLMNLCAIPAGGLLYLIFLYRLGRYVQRPDLCRQCLVMILVPGASAIALAVLPNSGLPWAFYLLIANTLVFPIAVSRLMLRLVKAIPAES